jgi:hypothetical protein
MGKATTSGITGVRFVGMRGPQLAEMAALFRDVIGATVARHTPDMIGFEFSDGTILELYGPDDEFHAFFTTGPVVGFRVEDFAATKARMVAAKIQFIGEAQHSAGVSWQHFHCPDGTVAEIIGPLIQGEPVPAGS